MHLGSWPCRAFLWLALLACTGSAAPAPTAAPTAPGKFLFLVEASAQTAPYAERVALVVADLIERGLGGRMQAGDWFHILPFNEQIDPLGYGPKAWQPAASRPISNLAFLYLQKYKFDKKPRMDRVMALVQQAVQTEGDLTVYLIVSGNDPILGTPFDAPINAVLNEHAAGWRNRRALCVIALVAERSRLRDWAVGAAEPPAPTRLVARMPEPPAPPPAPALSTHQISAAPSTKTNATVPPPPPVHTNVATPPAKPVEPSAPAPLPPQTNAVAVKPAPPQPTTPPSPSPPPPPSPAPSTQQVAVVKPPPELPPSPSPQPAITTAVAPAVVTVVNVATGAPSVTTPTAPTSPSIPPPSTTKTETTGPVETAIVPAATNPLGPANVNPGSSNALAQPATPDNPPPPPQAVAVLPQPSPTRYGFILAGIGLLLAAFWLGMVWRRRTAPAPSPSLITQSMDRQRPRPGRDSKAS